MIQSVTKRFGSTTAVDMGARDAAVNLRGPVDGTAPRAHRDLTRYASLRVVNNFLSVKRVRNRTTSAAQQPRGFTRR